MIFRFCWYKYGDIKTGIFESQAQGLGIDIEIYTLADKYEHLNLQADAMNSFRQ
jgi:hypothetical protein